MSRLTFPGLRVFTICLLLVLAMQQVGKTLAADAPKGAESHKTSDSKTEEKVEMVGKIGLNDRCPDLTLPDQSGKMISLKDFLGKKVLVVYFYPKDNTSICTAQACSFRDSYEKFKDLGAEVIGISSDSVKSHEKFAEKNHLPFPLLADTSGMARKAFGVPNSAVLLPGRVTYVVDKEGLVRHVFNSMLDGPKHELEAMKIVKELSESK